MPSTTRLTLVCHAGTAASRAAAFNTDEPIEERGAAQATLAAAKLHSADRAWASPALCARQTAMALGLEAVTEPALRECDFGRWRGFRLADIAATEPEAFAAWLADPSAAPHGGERISDVSARVAIWLDRCAQEGGRVVAVTHATVIRAAVVHAIGAPAQAMGRIDVAPLTLTELTCRNRSWRLRATGCGLI